MKKSRFYHIVVKIGPDQIEVFNETDIEPYYETVFIPHQSGAEFLTFSGFNITCRRARVRVYLTESKIDSIKEVLETLEEGDVYPFDASDNSQNVTAKTLAKARRRSLYPISEGVTPDNYHCTNNF